MRTIALLAGLALATVLTGMDLAGRSTAPPRLRSHLQIKAALARIAPLGSQLTILLSHNRRAMAVAAIPSNQTSPPSSLNCPPSSLNRQRPLRRRRR